MSRRTHNPTRAELLEWNPRERNVYAPKGVMRPRPTFLAAGPHSPRQTWSYRGWRIDLHEHARDRFDAKITTPRGNTYTVPDSPGEAESMQAAVFHIDRLEALSERSRDSLSARNRLSAAEDAVRRAIDELRAEGVSLDRSSVARRVQLLGRGPELVSEWAVAFRELPVSERLELIDEMLAVAATHGGRVPFVV